MLAGDAQGAVETAARAQRAVRVKESGAGLIAELILGTALYRVGQVREGLQVVRSGAAIAKGKRLEPEYLVHAAHVLTWAGEYGQAQALLRKVIDEIRSTGALGVLPFALYASSGLDTRTGRWTSAYADASEAVRIAADTDNPFWRCHALGCVALVEAGQGREEQCKRARRFVSMCRSAPGRDHS